MHNSYFRFKQFVVHHNLTAMKVGTDGVLLGAWVDVDNPAEILDIGTGSGLLALMLAQRSNAGIHAIDIDADACRQARFNVSLSPWENRIQVFNQSLQEFVAKNEKKYDLIVCNPPFFVNSLKNPDPKRSNARHNDMLPLTELFKGSASLLQSENGKLNIILPFDQMENAIALAKEYNLNAFRRTLVQPTPSKPFHRVLLGFWFGKENADTRQICIEMNLRHEYSEEYKELTKDFYLKFSS